MKHALLILLVIAATVACADDNRFFSPEDVGVVVVDARLIVDDEFPMILVTRALSPDGEFFFNSAILADAVVTITSDGGLVMEYDYEGLGRYFPRDPDTLVLPDETYRLRVETPDGEVVTAVTTTPKRMRVNEWVLLAGEDGKLLGELATFAEYGDSVYTRPTNVLTYSQGLLEARIDRAGFLAFQISISSIDEGSDFVINPDFFDEEDFEDLERNTSSPPLDIPDGNVSLPWFAIFFEGRHIVRLFAVDENWYDLARSVPQIGGSNGGFGGNAGDSFERPLFNVNGGIGLFGSAAVDSVGFTVLPRD